MERRASYDIALAIHLDTCGALRRDDFPPRDFRHAERSGRSHADNAHLRQSAGHDIQW